METNKKLHVTRMFADDPNAELIENFLRQEFPDFHGGNVESILNAIVEELIGTRQVRLAGRPTPESEVAIREVVRKSMEAKLPIPILVVSGPKKTDTSKSIDLAELSALRVLACIQKRILPHYEPGVNIRIRLEDTTGFYLEKGVPGLEMAIQNYTNDFRALNRVLGYDFITPVRESQMMTQRQFETTANGIFIPLMEYLTDSASITDESKWVELESFKTLLKMGWKGTIPTVMREYYERRYSHLFPEYSEHERLEVTGKYLAGTLARNLIGATGASPDWTNGFVQVNFAAPVPGIPSTMVSTRLFYRTVPLVQTKRHIPFWRAKGFLKLNGSAHLALADWNEQFDYQPFKVTFKNMNESVVVDSDYVIE